MRKRVYGTVVIVAGQHKWEVKFDFNGVEKDITSKLLQLTEEGPGILTILVYMRPTVSQY